MGQHLGVALAAQPLIVRVRHESAQCEQVRAQVPRHVHAMRMLVPSARAAILLRVLPLQVVRYSEERGLHPARVVTYLLWSPTYHRPHSRSSPCRTLFCDCGIKADRMSAMKQPGVQVSAGKVAKPRPRLTTRWAGEIRAMARNHTTNQTRRPRAPSKTHPITCEIVVNPFPGTNHCSTPAQSVTLTETDIVDNSAAQDHGKHLVDLLFEVGVG